MPRQEGAGEPGRGSEEGREAGVGASAFFLFPSHGRGTKKDQGKKKKLTYLFPDNRIFKNQGYAGPHDAGSYNDAPDATGFFAGWGGAWDSEYG